MFRPKSLVHAFALARLQESSLNFRGIYYADLEVKDEVYMAEIENEMVMKLKGEEFSSEGSYENVEVTEKVWLEQTETGMVMNLKEKESSFEGNFELMNSTSFAAQEKFNSLKFKEELHSITAPEIAIQLSKNSSSTLGGGSNPEMDDVDVDDVVWNKSIGVLQGKFLDVGHNLVGYPRAEGLAVAEVKGADLLSRVPAPHLEFGGWKKYLNFRDELLKDTQESLRDMNAMVPDAIHTAPKVLHKWIEEPRHRTTRILQVAREHFYKTERCLLYLMRMFGNDILSPFASGDESRFRSVERGKRNFKHQLVKQELISQVVCLAPPPCLVTEFMSSGRVFDDLQNQKSILKLPGTLKITIDVTEGMSYLHQNTIVHRGLKVANLWMDKNKVLMTVNAAVFGGAQVLVQLGIMTAEAEIFKDLHQRMSSSYNCIHLTARSGSNMIVDDVVALFLEGHEVVFNEPASLPPFRDHNHQILLKEGTRDIASRSYSSVQKVVIEKDALSRVHTSDSVISLGRRKGGSLQESFEVYEVGCSKLGQRKLFFQLWETILKLGNRGNGEIESAPHKIEEPKHRTERVFQSRGCLGCCTKPPFVISVDEPSKGLKIQGQRVKQHSLTEDFWSPSSGDMDNSAFPSYRSVSSISTSNQTLDTNSSTGGTSSSSEFVNHGKFFYIVLPFSLLLWNETRQQWVGNKGPQEPGQAQEPKLSFNATYESLLGTNKPFPQPIPLPEMVDFLVDVWEQEGLYD
ncbi:hypothetical protein SASPL_150784 [Salvia splendens]|uniref:Protein kinase domain-containing protein n=1 Tax=Salvia splendens TaxID=180675 RepID=A0A8X8W7D8_SALSN|nr:hypothetical protein SASPL_150784 [Salvia splendens]